MPSTFPVDKVRAEFPSLSLSDEGKDRIYFDNPAGTQVPKSVAAAVSGYMLSNASNYGGAFRTSQASDAVLVNAQEDMATFLNAKSASEIVIGPSMTALTFQMSRSICADFKPGDEIILTRAEHEGNVGPWLGIAADKGAVIKWVDINLDSWMVEPEDLSKVLSDRTRLVCLNYASNLTGSVNNVAALGALAKAAGAYVYVDAVQLAPHHPVDVQSLGCDFLVCSAYKFFGPHLGVFWGHKELLRSLPVHKGRCVYDELPDRYTLGTPQFELFAGLSATLDYFVSLGRDFNASLTKREAVELAYQKSIEYEEKLTARLIEGIQTISGTTIFGITNPNRMRDRVPTVSFRSKRGLLRLSAE